MHLALHVLGSPHWTCHNVLTNNRYAMCTGNGDGPAAGRQTHRRRTVSGSAGSCADRSGKSLLGSVRVRQRAATAAHARQACGCWCRGLPVWSVRRGVVRRLRCRSKRAERWQGAGGICWVARAARYARLLPIARMQLPKWVPAEAVQTVGVNMKPLWCEYVVSARVSTRQCLVQLQGSVRCNVGGIWTCLRNHRSMTESRMSP